MHKAAISVALVLSTAWSVALDEATAVTGMRQHQINDHNNGALADSADDGHPIREQLQLA